jgi:outer membrane lipopolysaccharide assembly protein LptE/RlpB
MTPDQFTALLVALTGLIGAVTACYVQLRQTHELQNGRMSELIAVVRAAASKEGELAGRDYVRRELLANGLAVAALNPVLAPIAETLAAMPAAAQPPGQKKPGDGSPA